jgi:hypothetical protein
MHNFNIHRFSLRRDNAFILLLHVCYYRKQYVMLGQAQLTLRDIVDFTKKNTFDVNFLDKIKVVLSVFGFDFFSFSLLLCLPFYIIVSACGVEGRV